MISSDQQATLGFDRAQFLRECSILEGPEGFLCVSSVTKDRGWRQRAYRGDDAATRAADWLDQETSIGAAVYVRLNRTPDYPSGRGDSVLKVDVPDGGRLWYVADFDGPSDFTPEARAQSEQRALWCFRRLGTGYVVDTGRYFQHKFPLDGPEEKAKAFVHSLNEEFLSTHEEPLDGWAVKLDPAPLHRTANTRATGGFNRKTGKASRIVAEAARHQSVDVRHVVLPEVTRRPKRVTEKPFASVSASALSAIQGTFREFAARAIGAVAESQERQRARLALAGFLTHRAQFDCGVVEAILDHPSGHNIARTTAARTTATGAPTLVKILSAEHASEFNALVSQLWRWQAPDAVAPLHVVKVKQAWEHGVLAAAAAGGHELAARRMERGLACGKIGHQAGFDAAGVVAWSSTYKCGDRWCASCYTVDVTSRADAFAEDHEGTEFHCYSVTGPTEHKLHASHPPAMRQVLMHESGLVTTLVAGTDPGVASKARALVYRFKHDPEWEHATHKGTARAVADRFKAALLDQLQAVAGMPPEQAAQTIETIGGRMQVSNPRQGARWPSRERGREVKAQAAEARRAERGEEPLPAIVGYEYKGPTGEVLGHGRFPLSFNAARALLSKATILQARCTTTRASFIRSLSVTARYG